MLQVHHLMPALTDFQVNLFAESDADYLIKTLPKLNFLNNEPIERGVEIDDSDSGEGGDRDGHYLSLDQLSPSQALLTNDSNPLASHQSVGSRKYEQQSEVLRQSDVQLTYSGVNNAGSRSRSKAKSVLRASSDYS